MSAEAPLRRFAAGAGRGKRFRGAPRIGSDTHGADFALPADGAQSAAFSTEENRREGTPSRRFVSIVAVDSVLITMHGHGDHGTEISDTESGDDKQSRHDKLLSCRGTCKLLWGKSGALVSYNTKYTATFLKCKSDFVHITQSCGKIARWHFSKCNAAVKTCTAFCKFAFAG